MDYRLSLSHTMSNGRLTNAHESFGRSTGGRRSVAYTSTLTQAQFNLNPGELRKWKSFECLKRPHQGITLAADIRFYNQVSTNVSLSLLTRPLD